MVSGGKLHQSYDSVNSGHVHIFSYFSHAVLVKCLSQILSLLPDIFESKGQKLFLNIRELTQ